VLIGACAGAMRTPLIGRRMSGGPEDCHCVRLQPDAASAVDAPRQSS
jgi:hypothetical protein